MRKNAKINKKINVKGTTNGSLLVQREGQMEGTIILHLKKSITLRIRYNSISSIKEIKNFE